MDLRYLHFRDTVKQIFQIFDYKIIEAALDVAENCSKFGPNLIDSSGFRVCTCDGYYYTPYGDLSFFNSTQLDEMFPAPNLNTEFCTGSMRHAIFHFPY